MRMMILAIAITLTTALGSVAPATVPEVATSEDVATAPLKAIADYQEYAAALPYDDKGCLLTGDEWWAWAYAQNALAAAEASASVEPTVTP